MTSEMATETEVYRMATVAAMAVWTRVAKESQAIAPKIPDKIR